MHDREREDKARFARRLEAFSDIVFGFALAQCAFALEVPRTLAALNHKLPDLIYFALTFALIASFWTIHYRIFHYAFAGERLDVALNFALLAAVALLPYVLRVYLQFPTSVAGSVAYSIVLGATLSLFAALEVRGLRAHGAAMTPKVLRTMRRAVRRHAAAGAVFLTAAVLFIPFGLNARFLWLLAPASIVVLRRLERSTERPRGTSPAAIES